MRKFSKKRAAIERRYRKTLEEIKEERDPICTGCNNAKGLPLSFSHTIPRSRREDLIAEKENIEVECISMGKKVGCHQIWEYEIMENKSKLLNFDRKMDYIKRTDPEYYKILTELR